MAKKGRRAKRSVPVTKTGEEKRRDSKTIRVETPKRRNPAALAAKQMTGAGAHRSKQKYKRHPKHRHSGDA